MWPGLVGKGPDSEPPIDLETMLCLTASALAPTGLRARRGPGEDTSLRATVAISKLAKDAQVAVGGFYKHFGSRDELVAEAVSAAFGIWQRQKEATASTGRPLPMVTTPDSFQSLNIRPRKG